MTADDRKQYVDEAGIRWTVEPNGHEWQREAVEQWRAESRRETAWLGEQVAESEPVASVRIRAYERDDERFTALRHPVDGRWFVELPFRIQAAVEPADLRTFVDTVLRLSTERGANREIDHTLCTSRDTEIELLLFLDDDRIDLIAYAWFRTEDLGRDANGEKLAWNPMPFGGSYVEFDGVDETELVDAARTILRRLGPEPRA